MHVSGKLPDNWRDLLVGVATAWSKSATREPVRFHRKEAASDPRWPADVPHPDWTGVWGVGASGLVEVRDEPDGSFLLFPTPDGLARARELGVDVEPLVAFPPDHEWVDMVRLLAAALEVYAQEGQAVIGVRLEAIADRLGCPPNDPNLWSAVHLLAIDDYLDAQAAMPVRMATVLPLPRTYQLLRGWPSTEPETVTRRLDEALAAAIERTDDPEEETRLRRLRENARDVGKSVLAGAILAAGKYAAGGGV
jgi:hypothetical protein